MDCENCGYKMRFVGGRWACDGCTATAQPPPQDVLPTAEVPDSPYDSMNSLEYVTQQGRIIHGDDYTLQYALLTAEQRTRLAELDLDIALAIQNYRKDEVELATDRGRRTRR